MMIITLCTKGTLCLEALELDNMYDNRHVVLGYRSMVIHLRIRIWNFSQKYHYIIIICLIKLFI